MTTPQPESTHPLAHRADHLAPHKWKPGESGNPKGRKPRPLLSDELHDVLGEPVDPADLQSKSKLRAVAEKIVALTLAGNTKACELLAKIVEPRRMRAQVEATQINLLNVNSRAPIMDALDRLGVERARLFQADDGDDEPQDG